MRRFKRAQYSFCRRDDIARCFGNFEHTLSENKLWELSEAIKPRASASTDHLLDTGHQMPATRT